MKFIKAISLVLLSFCISLSISLLLFIKGFSVTASNMSFVQGFVATLGSSFLYPALTGVITLFLYTRLKKMTIFENLVHIWLAIISIILIYILFLYITNERRGKEERVREVTHQGTQEVGTYGEGEVDESSAVEVVATKLNIPWEIAFLPGGEILVTERPGNLLKIGSDRTVIRVSGVKHIGEGGLLGLALHPDFASNSYVYLYLTSELDGRTINRVERYRLSGYSLTDKRVIFGGILGGFVHDGGRIEFGPDGYLYITTGDAGNEKLSQDINSLNGKILRIEDDGSIPKDNPFGSAVYSYGHRNPQGLAWDDSGELWATEHGRSGVLSGYDELNLIKKGGNYGWPLVQGDQEMDGLIRPVLHSGPSSTWAPAGAEFIKGRIIFAGLRGSALYEAIVDGRNIVSFNKYFGDKYGRLRAVKLGPDGYLYITTSNRDGRGDIKNNDDKLLKIDPKIFN